MKIPKLYIKYAWPLDQSRRSLFLEKNFGPYPSIKEVREKTEEWKKVWDELNKDDKVFKLLVETTGLTLVKDLELYIFGTGLKAMSFPLMMPIIKGDKERIFTNKEFIETAIHEIIHRFIGDEENNLRIIKYWENIRKEYSNESILTQNHILLYAILETVLIGLFGKEKGLSLVDSQDNDPSYKRALDIVHEKGRDVLIQQFKSYLN